jgi:hypothetical protein
MISTVFFLTSLSRKVWGSSGPLQKVVRLQHSPIFALSWHKILIKVSKTVQFIVNAIFNKFVWFHKTVPQNEAIFSIFVFGNYFHLKLSPCSSHLNSAARWHCRVVVVRFSLNFWPSPASCQFSQLVLDRKASIANQLWTTC